MNENPFNNSDIKSYTIHTFGESIRQRRKQLGLTIRELAKSIGMSPMYLCEVERGNRSAPSGTYSGIDYMSALAEELELTESQKSVFQAMAVITIMKNNRLPNNYFKENPSALEFFIMAVEEKWDNEKWKKLVDNEKH